MAYAEPVEELDLPDKSPGAEALLEAAGEDARLNACLSQLDDRTEKVIRTAFFEGVTYEALARRMEAPLGTVKSWVRRGLAKLKGCLTQ
jgi:RNA polymerase sigma-70 factor (ECF subfamily)